MSLSVNTNAASLTAQLNLQASQSRLNTSLQRLSTGLRINGAGDDPAGLVTSSLQNAQISGLTQSIANIDRGVTLVQTADSALSNINDLLVKIRTLAADSANTATQSDASLTANQANADALLATIDTIANTTKFGTVFLLDGSFDDLQFQTGAFNGEESYLTIDAADSSSLGVDSIDLTSDSGAASALDDIDLAIETVATARGNLGAFQVGTLQATSANNAAQLNNLQQAQSQLTDTNYQTEIAKYTSENIRQQAASTVLGMANQSNASILQLLRGQ